MAAVIEHLAGTSEKLSLAFSGLKDMYEEVTAALTAGLPLSVVKTRVAQGVAAASRFLNVAEAAQAAVDKAVAVPTLEVKIKSSLPLDHT